MKSMRAVVAAVVVALPLVLSACSSGTAETTDAASGGVASLATCAQGPPAASPLSITDYADDNDYDGWVGAIYNNTDQPMVAWLVTGNTENSRCQVPAKGRAAYAVSLPDDIETYIRVAPLGDQQPYANLRIVDPDIGHASWYITTPVNPYKSCGTVFKAQSQAFREGSGFGETDTHGYGNGQGQFRIKRHSDDADVAREWTGVSNWKVDDWARVDVDVVELPYC